MNCVLSAGSPVKRCYGTLRISSDTVVLRRVFNSGIPLLDSHQTISLDHMLGRCVNAWIEDPVLLGTILFNKTRAGKSAEGMVVRKEAGAISIGYRVEKWQVTDQDGRILDPEVDRIRFDDRLIFTATKWELLEVDVVSVAADDRCSVLAGQRGIDALCRAPPSRLWMPVRA